MSELSKYTQVQLLQELLVREMDPVSYTSAQIASPVEKTASNTTRVVTLSEETLSKLKQIFANDK